MKQLIVTFAVLILLLAFPLQYVQNQRIHADMQAVQKIVHNAKELAKQDGCFTDSVKSSMVSDIATQLRVNTSEIQVVVDGLSARKERGGLIYYKVTYPVKNVIATPGFWGIRDSANTATRIIESYTSSEWLP